MSDLEKVREWIKTYPGSKDIEDYQVDLLDQIPYQNSIAPAGLVEISRREDLIGNVTAENQYNFGLYYAFPKDPQNNSGATENATWLMDFQKWVQEQSARGLTPKFGDIPKTERISAQNGTIYGTDEEGTAVYVVQLSANFTKVYEVN